ncbi:MAG: hypothetical protein H0W61_02110 [Bacteroidetes bacterium]|nr:hypothetical protein [Bacteroidota bacterium]
MRYLFSLGIFTAVTLLLNSCTVFKKSIPKPVKIVYYESEFNASLFSSASYTKYTDLVNQQEVSEGFLQNFKSEGSGTPNVILTTDETDADFILHLKTLRVRESSKTEKINDAKSNYNGMDVVLNSVECYAEFEIITVKDKNRRLNNCFNSKSRTEKVNNNRDLSDLISGSNKDHTQYHTKLLSDKIALNLAQDVGRRIWVPITRRISKALK